MKLFELEIDAIKWRWGTQGVYDIMMGGGKIKDRYSGIWKYKIPDTVKVFMFLMLRKRILTRCFDKKENWMQGGMCHVQINYYRISNASHFRLSVCKKGVAKN